MSNISTISSPMNPYQTTTQNSWRQRAQSFTALQTALQSGNLSDARQAFASLQQSQPNASPGAGSGADSASGQNSQASNAFQSLQSALAAGNLSGAQQAFATLQRNMESAAMAKTGRHYHHHGVSADTTTQTDNSTSGDTTAESIISALDVQA
jgi:outer membrane protein assembly factor BamD (BamD/ComL family)